MKYITVRSMNIRKAKSSDLNGILEIHKKGVITENSKEYSVEEIKEWIQNIKLKNLKKAFETDYFFVAENKSKILH